MTIVDDRWQQSLARAHEHRQKRAELRRAIRDGRAFVDDVLRKPPGYARTLKVLKLLSWPTYFGPTRARQLLRRNWIPEDLALEHLTDRQRELIVEDLLERHSHVLERERAA